MSRVISVAVMIAVGFVLAVRTDAGPDKIAFPENYKSHVLYTIVDRYDVKQYRELYGTPEAVQAMKEQRPLPSGSVLTIVQYKAQVDAAGTPLKDANGRFLKGDLVGFGVMEKRAGWGTEYPDELRNGEWEYSAFTADMKFNDKANFKACFQCHKPHEKQDYVISLTKLVGTPTAASAAASGATAVTIAGFAFGPATLNVEAGKSVQWTNTDDSPHQITVTGSGARSPILVKGQTYAQAFDKTGSYDYVCGLHPNMKGKVEVK